MQTLSDFSELYCSHKHKKGASKQHRYLYKDAEFSLETTLCKECEELLEYAVARLQACPHEIKPRCRECEAPCYDKYHWKQMAKMMRYSGIHKGLVKFKKFFKR